VTWCTNDACFQPSLNFSLRRFWAFPQIQAHAETAHGFSLHELRRQDGKKLCFFTSNPFFLDLFEIIISIAGQDCWCGCRFLRWHTGNQWSLDQPMESFKLGESSGLVRLPSNTAGQSFQDGGKTWQNCKCYLKFCAMCDLCHASARISQVSIPHRWTQPLGPRVGCSQETSFNLNHLERTWINWTPDWPSICWPQIDPMTNQWHPLTTGPVPSASALGCCRGGSMPLGGYWGFKFDPKIS
jgi:hypothetical protein